MALPPDGPRAPVAKAPGVRPPLPAVSPPAVAHAARVAEVPLALPRLGALVPPPPLAGVVLLPAQPHALVPDAPRLGPPVPLPLADAVQRAAAVPHEAALLLGLGALAPPLPLAAVGATPLTPFPLVPEAPRPRPPRPLPAPGDALEAGPPDAVAAAAPRLAVLLVLLPLAGVGLPPLLPRVLVPTAPRDRPPLPAEPALGVACLVAPLAVQLTLVLLAALLHLGPLLAAILGLLPLLE
mmetsp:Transcript_27472/g.53588  ORF Transcript_27472/g.53588 Transcript_27472/m.53588 type:complete len:239 (-) Transcript_27472:153-869(-)